MRHVIVLANTAPHQKGRRVPVFYTGCRGANDTRIVAPAVDHPTTLVYESRLMAERDLARQCADDRGAYVLDLP